MPSVILKSALELRNSGIKIQCVDAGWKFSDIPLDAQRRLKFEDIVNSHPYHQNQTLLYAVPQNNGIDIEDQIALGAKLLKEVAIKGL